MFITDKQYNKLKNAVKTALKPENLRIGIPKCRSMDQTIEIGDMIKTSGLLKESEEPDGSAMSAMSEKNLVIRSIHVHPL